MSLLLFSAFNAQDAYYPILMKRSDLEVSVKLTNTAMLFTHPGKIYLYQNWIFLIEKYKGIHLIDNSNPSNPIKKAFLKVPGCMDVAVRNNILYVDNAVDLVAVRLDFVQMTATVVSRKAWALPEIESPDGYIPEEYMRSNRPDATEIVGWMSNAEYSAL